jgi:hypothetical protein
MPPLMLLLRGIFDVRAQQSRIGAPAAGRTEGSMADFNAALALNPRLADALSRNEKSPREAGRVRWKHKAQVVQLKRP